MGTGMENYIPKFREREWEWKIAFPTFGNGNEKLIPKREREWEADIPGNGRERKFPLTPIAGRRVPIVLVYLRLPLIRCCHFHQFQLFHYVSPGSPVSFVHSVHQAHHSYHTIFTRVGACP